MMPNECNMPALDDLNPPATHCYLAACLAGGLNLEHGRPVVLYKRIVNLIDKATYEYSKARESLNSQVVSEREWKGEMHILAIGNHLETCICTLVIIFNLLERVSHALSTSFEEQVRDILDSKDSSEEKIRKITETAQKIETHRSEYTLLLKQLKARTAIRKIRNVITHIDEKILSGKSGSIMVTLNESGSEAQILDDTIKLTDLADCMRELYTFIRKSY